jgi:hypothetical protein
MGGWLQFGRGEVGWGRRRRNRGREEERVSAEAVYTGFADGITDGMFRR